MSSRRSFPLGALQPDVGLEPARQGQPGNHRLPGIQVARVDVGDQVVGLLACPAADQPVGEEPEVAPAREDDVVRADLLRADRELLDFDPSWRIRLGCARP